MGRPVPCIMCASNTTILSFTRAFQADTLSRSDTDPGVDDVLAILLALSSPDLLVVGITLTHGNCTLDSAADNLRKTFYALEREIEADPTAKERYRNVDLEWRTQHGAGPIEVYLGSEGPIEGKPVTAKYFHGKVSIGSPGAGSPAATL